MQCNSAKIWLSDAPDADLRWSDHLASCASCRAETEQAEQLRRAMRTLPETETPAAVAGRLQELTAATATRSLECAETLDLLEPYREGLLTAEESFLVEDHLLWCASCAEALEVADQLTTVLRALPQVAPPDSIAERLVQARLPWWQRLWTAPAPSFSLRRVLQVGGAMAAVALLFAVLVNMPEKGKPVASVPKKDAAPVTSTAPSHGDPVGVNPAPKVGPGQIAVVLPNVTVQNVKKPADVDRAKRHPDDEIIAVLPIDPMVVPVAKALLPLAGINPDAMIQPRDGAPKDGPVVAKIETRDDYKIVPPPPPPPDKNVSATAREKLIEMNSEYALARSEEELASLPDTMKSATLLRPDAPRPSGPAPVLTASTEEVSRTVSGSLKRENPSLAPITVKSTRNQERIGGTVFIIPMDSDG